MPAAALLDSIDPALGEEARRQQESLQRRLADQKLLQGSFVRGMAEL